MYLNFNLYPKELLPEDLFYLLAIKQVNMNIIVPDDILSRFETLSLVKYVKGKAKEEKRLKLRISDKGKDLLEKLEEVEVSEDTLKIFEWIKNVYLSSGREIGNAKKTKLYIEQFSVASGIQRNSLAFLIQTFIKDASQFEWSKVLQYLFFKADNAFTTRFDINSSKLYQYYLKHRDYFNDKFKELDGRENC